MKAVLLDEFGGADVLKVGEIDKPSPKANEVLIKVVATSINRPDLVQRAGNYPAPTGDSEILGLEVSGVIEKLGSDAKGWSVGDRVIALVGGGGYAEYAVAYDNHVMPLPESMSFEVISPHSSTFL
jgi:NADPH:quinone reductase-like Zn-dependent oxidoreductase